MWLVGWVPTDLAGYAQVTIGVTTSTVPSAYQNFPDWFAALRTELTTDSSWTLAMADNGQITISGASAAITWPDRAGWLLGFNEEAGTAHAATTSLTAASVSPAAIPLISATWTRVFRERENKVTVDRQMRGHGYTFGGAAMWRFDVRMSREAATVMQRGGWFGKGKVIVTKDKPDHTWADTGWSTSNTDGYIEGYMVGIEHGSWKADVRDTYTCRFVVAKAP